MLLDTYKVGFALEGNGDYPILPVLTRRLIAEEFPDLLLQNDTVIRPRKTGHGFISELPTFAATIRAAGCDMLVAVVDSDTLRASQRLQRLRDAKAVCEGKVPICVAEGVAVRAIESWLLADDAALHATFGGDRHKWVFPNPENLDMPKTMLNTLVRQQSGGSEVSFASYAGDVAARIDIELLRRRCSSFDRLARNIINCVRQWKLAQS